MRKAKTLIDGRGLITWWLAGCYMLYSMNEEIYDYFTDCETYVELWNKVGERYGQSNGPMINQLKKKIDSLKQENNTLMVYLVSLRGYGMK